jgi:hypothetical protein
MLENEPSTARLGINEALLRSEIGFWQELIDACDDTQDDDSLERMRQALALAEFRLCRLFADHHDSRHRESRHSAKVYHLDFSP